MGESFVHKQVTEEIIRCAVAVHQALGPGLLEGAYQKCLKSEFRYQGIRAECEVPIRIVYRDEVIPVVYRLDFVVERLIIVELKAIAAIPPVATAQMLTYLKLAALPVGLLVNFNSNPLRSGIKRFVNNRSDMSF